MDERLSPIEAIMWKAGQDPTLRMTVGIVMVLDRAPSYDSLVERFAAVIKRSPRLQSRPGDPSLAHACPLWVEDDALDAEHHLRTAALSRPGSLRQLLDLASVFESVPFDPNRAPWDGTLIEGLEGGRAALYLRAHHVVTDGLAGLRLAGRFLDGDEIDVHEEKAPASGGGSGTATIDLTKALRPLQVAVNAVRDPEPVNAIVRGLQGVLDLATSISRQVMITGGSLSPLLVDHSMTTRFEVISVPGARAAALALGGSRNDLLVAGAAAGLGLYHERLGSPCRRAAALHSHQPASRSRCWWQLVCPGACRGADRGRARRAALRDGRRPFDPRARGAGAAVRPRIGVDDQLPPCASAHPGLARASGHRRLRPRRRSPASVGRVASAALVSRPRYPFGPRLGCPVNLTAFGNNDRLDVGIALDPAAITEPAVFLECLGEAFDQLVPRSSAR